MGMEVKEFDLRTLRTIALPARVAPALFWMVPIGEWLPRQYCEMKELFEKDRDSVCYRHGLMLSKRCDESDGTALGGRLGDLIPEGWDRFVSKNAAQLVRKAPGLLVFAGGFPHPGWGVLIDVPPERECGSKELANWFEKTIRDTLHSPVLAASNLDVFLQAHQAHLELGALQHEGRRKKRDAQLALETLRVSYAEYESAIQVNKHSLALNKLRKAKESAARILPSGDDVLRSMTSLIEFVELYDRAAKILSVPEDVIATQISPLVDGLGSSTEESQFDLVRSKLAIPGLQGALFVYWWVKVHYQVIGAAGVITWAQAMTRELNLKIVDVTCELRSAIDVLAPDREICSEIHSRMKEAIAEAIDLQWNLGPHFLSRLEQNCRENGLVATSIPWDPARMIGWKLAVAGHCFDIKLFTREGFVTDQMFSNENSATRVDGSYFTDLIHYMAVKHMEEEPQLCRSPRDMTMRVLLKGLDPDSMRHVSINLGLGPLDRHVRPPDHVLVDELLEKLGWHRRFEQSMEMPLAAFLLEASPSYDDLIRISLHELRRSLESFCKDIIDVVVSEHGCSEVELWTLIGRSVPEYRRRNSVWTQEIKKLTIGSAILILKALKHPLYEASRWDSFLDTLTQLSDNLNSAAHHNGTPEWDLPEQIRQALSLTARLIEQAKAMFGELPWHLQVSSVFGSLPQVLSGHAWSHGARAPRLIRVISWNDGATPGKSVLVWNRSGKNPVMPDARFIERP